ncbi:hypothetical protein JCM25156A_05380 [Komagataeibacter kakiaceti JCM 25156]|uniref:NADH-quinone oxidoreductase subunit B family protein n=1 Tax=Komagataeibacter kakiaceti TaxID=943261 RepID=UPI0004719A8A|nr:formate hydrogenlyase [Komagataeibacter kakiaceti]
MAYLHLFRRGAALPRLAALDIFHMETGGCTGCALELRAFIRGGKSMCGTVRLVSTPRQAGMLLLTGSLTVEMAPVVEMAWQAMPGPRVLAAVGDCAVNGGLFPPGYATLGGVGTHARTSLSLPGCPPAPEDILAALTDWQARDGADGAI